VLLSHTGVPPHSKHFLVLNIFRGEEREEKLEHLFASAIFCRVYCRTVGPGTIPRADYGNAHVEVLHKGSLKGQKYSREIGIRRVVNVYGLSIYYGLSFSEIIFPAQEEIRVKDSFRLDQGWEGA